MGAAGFDPTNVPNMAALRRDRSRARLRLATPSIADDEGKGEYREKLFDFAGADMGVGSKSKPRFLKWPTIRSMPHRCRKSASAPFP